MIDPAYIVTAADRAEAQRRTAVPERISFIQLIAGLVGAEWITPEEGDAWFVNGVLPPAAQAVISSLPPQARFVAKIRATRPSIIERNDPLVAAMAQVQGKTDREMDDFFTAAAAI